MTREAQTSSWPKEPEASSRSTLTNYSCSHHSDRFSARMRAVSTCASASPLSTNPSARSLHGWREGACCRNSALVATLTTGTGGKMGLWRLNSVLLPFGMNDATPSRHPSGSSLPGVVAQAQKARLSRSDSGSSRARRPSAPQCQPFVGRLLAAVSAVAQCPASKSGSVECVVSAVRPSSKRRHRSLGSVARAALSP